MKNSILGVTFFLSRSVLGAVTIGLYVVLWGTEDDGESESMVEQDNIVVKVESESHCYLKTRTLILLRHVNDIALL